MKAVNQQDNDPPDWFSQFPGNMSVESVVEDVMNCMAEVAGGCWRHVLFAPNNLSEFTNLSRHLSVIEFNQFMQTCVVDVEDGVALTSTCFLTE